MFEVPSASPSVREVVISEETIQKGEQPLLIYQKSAAGNSA
jgi:ATP-dependent protease Clp ATPase subunit